MKFNETKQSVEERTKTLNYEGGEAFDPDSAEMALYKVVANNLLEDNFYTEDEDQLRDVQKRFNAAVEDGKGEFALRLAVYARNEMGLRDVSQLLLVLAANRDETQQHVRTYAPAVMRRADEPATVIAMHDELFGGHLPQCLVKGINDTLHTFDEYQFAKYDSDRRQVNLKDVFNRTHPKPRTDNEEELFERLMRGDLDDYPDVEPLREERTWEAVISEKGSTPEAWRSVVDEMGVFAKLRNVRNMRENGLRPEEIFEDDDLNGIRHSRMLPFRIYQSYKAVKDAGLSNRELDEAYDEMLDVAMENVPDYLGDSLVVADTSASMDTSVSGRSDLTCDEIASLFTAVAGRKGADVGAFADDFEMVTHHARMPVLELAEKVRHAGPGGSTNGHKVLDYLTRNNISVDRVVLLTDMQIWDSTGRWGGPNRSVKDAFEEYRDRVNSEASLYMIDLQNYGDLVTPEGYEGVFNVSGWNSNVLEFIEYAENPGDIIDEVNGVEPERHVR